MVLGEEGRVKRHAYAEQNSLLKMRGHEAVYPIVERGCPGPDGTGSFTDFKSRH